MDPFQAMVKGVLQGLTEFLPISSSAHLVLIPWLFGWQDSGLTFDVALHVGTLFAVLAYFWRDWWQMLQSMVRTLAKRRLDDDPAARMFLLLVLASIPAAVVGAIAEEAVESWLREPLIIAALLIGLGALMLVAEAIASRDRLLKHIGLPDAVLIGLSQALAICPGVSRSGITITAGLFRGLTREAAARFSFLMSMPIIGGAGIYNLRHLVSDGLPPGEQLSFAIGFISAAVVGFLTIKLLLHYLQRNSLRVFAYYRFALGLLVLTFALVGPR
jgi:undecaprenyl-diphosphatase